MAAVLHDTVEDTETTFEELEETFGREVRDLVAEVTDDKRLSKAERKRQQQSHAPHSSDRAKLIKIADKTCNVRDVGRTPPTDWDLTRRKEYLEWSRAVVAGCRGANPALERHFDECLAASADALGVSPATG